MLVLTRKIGTQIRIGDDIIVKVLSHSGGGVRLGIDCSPDIAVHREEIYNQIHNLPYQKPAQSPMRPAVR